jgi:drug/metabolite transporter (DMT)-like permease
MNGFSARTTIFVLLALLAFAGNSVLCRLALVDNAVDEFSFTIFRLLSGSLVLYALMSYRRCRVAAPRDSTVVQLGSWWASVLLFVYAIFFSVAYVRVDTGVGALILFGTVQITMIFSAFLKGNRISAMEWLGVLLAVFGVGYLLWPGEGSVAVVSWWGALMMIVSGIAWGLYSLHGASSQDALADTAANFLRTIPMVACLLVVFVFQSPVLSGKGIWLAVASGALMSGVGYSIWYAVLPSLNSIQGAVIQLLVPILAAVGGVLFAHERISADLVVSSTMVLGGIFLVVMFRSRTLN